MTKAEDKGLNVYIGEPVLMIRLIDRRIAELDEVIKEQEKVEKAKEEEQGNEQGE